MKIPGDPLDGAKSYGLAIIVIGIATAINAFLAPYVAHANLIMVYLLGVTYVASRCTPRAAVLASFLGVLVFDFAFVHPSGTLAVSDVEYVFTFFVMLVVSLLISTLTLRLREHSEAKEEAHMQTRIEQMRGDLLSAVSHDLRTPLASIEGSADALLNQPGLSTQSEALAETILDESHRMARLVQNLLDMTRVQGTVELDLDWHSLDELAANAIQRTSPLLTHTVKLVRDGAPPLVRVDGVLIEQVLVNLLENAARHAGRESHVAIAIRREGDLWNVAVADDGPGLPGGAPQKLFDRFERSGGTGFGLGLTICRAAVEAHGGTISAAANAGKGAVFTFTLPAGDP